LKEKLKIALNRNARGESLLPVIAGTVKYLPPRHLFIESDFSTESMRTVYPSVEEVVLEGVEALEVNPVTTRLTLRPNMLKMIIRSKQYADIYDHWMLALYPQDNKKRMPILVDMQTGEWTDDLQSPFAKNSPVILMQQQLKLFYGDEIL
jgi:hypothetical protein